MERLKPRIAFTVINDLQSDQRMQRICTTLQAEGYECLLIGRDLGKIYNDQYTFLSKRIRCIFNRGPLMYLEYNIRLIIFLLSQKYNAICSIDADTVLAGRLATMASGAKWIFDAHEWFSEVPEVRQRKVVKRIWNWLEGMAFRKAALVYTVGPALADIFSGKYNRKVHVIRNMPLLAKEQFNIEKKKDFILYQGALNRGRGLELLIRCMAEIPLKLVIAGEGDLSLKLRQLTENMGLGDKVEFRGWVEPQALKLLTARAWLGYNVSENDGDSYYYSLNNKYFDYIHGGTPSLMNDFPEYRKLNEAYHTGILVNHDAVEITNAIIHLMEKPELYKNLVDNCKQAALNLCWDKEQVALVSLYRSVL